MVGILDFLESCLGPLSVSCFSGFSALFNSILSLLPCVVLIGEMVATAFGITSARGPVSSQFKQCIGSIGGASSATCKADWSRAFPVSTACSQVGPSTTSSETSRFSKDSVTRCPSMAFNPLTTPLMGCVVWFMAAKDRESDWVSRAAAFKATSTSPTVVASNLEERL